MTESLTPICDLIEKLMSQGLSRDMSLEAARTVEATLVRATTSGRSDLERRERARVRKARWRSETAGHVPGTDADPISSTKTQSLFKKERKKEPSVPSVPGTNVTPNAAPADDWPIDYVEQFWKAFPPYRRQAKAKVAVKLQRIRASKVTWETVFGGVLKFAATNPGEYAPAPMVWLNDGRWDREYGTQRGGTNAQAQFTDDVRKAGFSGIAARMRYGSPEPERPAPEDLEPINRR